MGTGLQGPLGTCAAPACPLHLSSRAGRREGPSWAGGRVCFTAGGRCSAAGQGGNPAPGPAGAGGCWQLAGVLAACGPATPLLQDLGLKVPRLTLQQHSGHCPLWSWTPALSTGRALGSLGRTCFCTPFSGWTHTQPVLPRAGVAPLSMLLSGWPLLGPSSSVHQTGVGQPGGGRPRAPAGPRAGVWPSRCSLPWAGKHGGPPQGVVTTPGAGGPGMLGATAGWASARRPSWTGLRLARVRSMCLFGF